MFIGVRMDGAAVEAALDSALLSDAEASEGGPEAWGRFIDPFRLWAPSARDKTLALLPRDVAERVKVLEGLQKPADALAEAQHADRKALELKRVALLAGSWAQRAVTLLGPEGSSSQGTPGLRVAALPNFWLTAMQNHPDVEPAISERDEAVLEALVDISWEYLTDFEVSFCVALPAGRWALPTAPTAFALHRASNCPSLLAPTSTSTTLSSRRRSTHRISSMVLRSVCARA